MALLKPDLAVARVSDVDLGRLHQRGITSLVIDLDNTLCEWNALVFSEEVMAWVADAKRRGFRILVVSNNQRERVERAARILDVPCIWSACKPLPFAYLRALKLLDTHKKACALIGDQLFTDMMGGNLAGLFTVLVDPLADKELWFTKMMRRVEKMTGGKYRTK